jgi:hypothetical protein
MTEDPELVQRVSRAADRLCHLMWLFTRSEPEVRSLAETSQSLGFPHYLTSRLGVIEPDLWADEVYVAPRSLIDHLLPRCIALDPPAYVEKALTAAGNALRRLAPKAPLGAISTLADRIQPEGALPSGWARWPRLGDAPRDAIRDAMLVREDRALGHYRAAASLGLTTLELMALTAVWRGQSVAFLSKGFKWEESEVQAAVEELQKREILDSMGLPTDQGRRLREVVEQLTDEWAGRYLDSVAAGSRFGLGSELAELAEGLAT